MRCNRCKCQNQTVDGRKFCQYHLDLFKANAIRKTKKRKQNNCCHECGKPKEQIKKLRCNKCLEISKIKFKQRFEDNKQKGICVICSQPRNNFRSSYCNKCASKDKKRSKKKRQYCKENSLCYKCMRPSPNKKVLCLDCAMCENIRKNIIFILRKKEVPKTSKTEDLLGCSIIFFREHIKNLMEPWMNENNYGVHVPGERKWQLGHRVPVAAFNMKDPDQQKKCWHYTNLYPQEAQENICNGDIMFLNGEKIRGRNFMVD